MKRFGIAVGACALLSTASSNVSAATINVPSGGNLQAALDAAKPGDTIMLAAGATWTGNFKLPAKGGTTPIVVRSSTPDGSLPAAGVRMSPSYAAKLARIRNDKNGPALKTSGAASYWTLMFLEFAPSVSGSSANLVEFGGAGTSQSTLSSVPQHLVMDRCYLHGDPSYGQRRGLSLNSGDTQILNSYFADFKGVNQDTQAIMGWNGPGPYVIENNYLEAAGENIMFGGTDPNIPNLVPSNIVIRRNLVSKPLAWMTQSWTVKNLVEFKSAQNVLVEGNTIENNWAAGQQGYSILFTPRNQSGTAPWTIVKNITVQNNVIHHVAAVFNIAGYDNLATSQQTQGIVITNNLIYDVSNAYHTSSQTANGWLGVIGAGPKNITFDHNTFDNDGTSGLRFYKGQAPTGYQISGFVFTNNFVRDNKYGALVGDNSTAGSPSLSMYTPGHNVHRNAIGTAVPKAYPTDNDVPTIANWLTNFVNAAGDDFHLVSWSPEATAATDGTAVGVSFSALNAAMNGAGTTPSPAPAPAPGPTPTPDPAPTPTPDPGGSTPYTGTPVALPGTVQFENYDAGGSEVAYHDTTSGNSGGVYRSNNVDIQTTTDTGGGYNIAWVKATEWLKYTVSVASARDYTIDVRVASTGAGGTFHVEVDGVDMTGPIAVPDTGGWQAWKTISQAGVTFTAGLHVVRVVMDTNGPGGSVANFNWFALK